LYPVAVVWEAMACWSGVEVRMCLSAAPLEPVYWLELPVARYWLELAYWLGLELLAPAYQMVHWLVAV
jgi:hypothetical protein